MPVELPVLTSGRHLMPHAPSQTTNGSGQRTQLRKQEATSVVTESLESRKLSNKQFTTLDYAESTKRIDSLIDENDDDEDDVDDDESDVLDDDEVEDMDEKANFSPAINKTKMEHKRDARVAMQQGKLHDRHSPRHNPNSRISSSNSQSSQNKRSDWLEQNAYLQSDANKRNKEHKIAMFDGPYRYPNEMYHAKQQKTKTVILILKFFVLVLLTLLLLMLLTGMIMAGQYLPKIFNDLMSAPRTFNVTISG